MSITSQISSMEAELHQLRIQNDSLQQSCDMLTEQNNRRESDMLILLHERDEARRVAAEVQTLIEGVGKMAIDGITRMRAAKTPLVRQAAPGNTAAVLAASEYK